MITMLRWFLFSYFLYLNKALGQDHHDQTQQSFSASNELGEKWGIDVSWEPLCMRSDSENLNSGLSRESAHLPIYLMCDV